MTSRTFKEQIGRLKRAGLLPPAYANVDIRSIRTPDSLPPMFRKRANSLMSAIKKYPDVAAGHAKTVDAARVHLTRTEQKQLDIRRAPSHGKLIVPVNSPEKRVSVNKSGLIRIRDKAGFQTVELPVPEHKVANYLKELRKDKKAINRMKTENEYFGFRFYGNNSSKLYSNFDQMLSDWTNGGVSGKGAPIVSMRPKEQHEIFRNLEIVRVPKPADWNFGGEQKRRAKRTVSESEAARRRSKKAQQARDYRKRLKSAEKSDYKEAARGRAAKSKRKAKKK